MITDADHEAIQRLVAQAPPLGPEQSDRIVMAVGPGVQAAARRHAGQDAQDARAAS
jgi:hypothetical protein